MYRLIEDFLQEKIVTKETVGGGCIADAKMIKTQSGKRYFLKSLRRSLGMFQKEANGLRELAKSETIRIPNVILVHNEFILLEAIQSGPKQDDFFADFGSAFARMHRYTSSTFGFYENNFIGASSQYNVAEGDEENDWLTFYYNKRLLPQLKMAEKQGHATAELSKGMHKLETRLHKILAGSEEKPSLLHGDLWRGNYMCDELGKAVIIDPAVYYGHREADLAMTKMFGGFTPEFYVAYQNEFPLLEGWEYRQNLYLLYHTLNHLNLFGNGYYQSSLQLINAYL